MNATLSFHCLLLATFLIGCSKWGDPVAGAKASGDLVGFVLKCATNRGGHLFTNGLPSIQAEWTLQANLLEDMIFVPGDHFDEIQSFLSHAFGELEPSKGSLPISTNQLGTRSGFYGIQQAGVGLQFSGDSNQTVICIIGPTQP